MHKLFFILILTLVGACEKKQAPQTSPLSDSDKLKQGELIYKSTCVVCHNVDPTKAGSVGPEIANSSLELLRSHVLYGKYPDGYTPKRTTHIMPQFPHLKGNLESLEIYLKR